MHTAIATHTLVHFTVDDTTCVVPVGKITAPPIEQLKLGVPCTVQWTGAEVYEGNIFSVLVRQLIITIISY